ncbi:hypothetical protein ACSVIJ_05355 [Pseudomonas sp. NCHU5208]|uniref:hypothetical protein n=1 Tax=unclassified Pseudomonas TaxID=196821 RepID=UPI003F985245
MHQKDSEKPDLDGRRSIVAYGVYCLSMSLLVQLLGGVVTWPYDLYLVYAYLPLTTALVMPLLAHGLKLSRPADLVRIGIGVLCQTVYISTISTSQSATDSISQGGDPKFILSVALTIAASAWLSATLVKRFCWSHFRLSRTRSQ